MIKEGKFGTYEAIWLLSLLCSAKVLLTYPRTIIDLGGTAGWVIVIIAALVGLLGFQIIASLLKRFPGQNIIEAGKSAAGPIVGSIAAIIYLSFFISATSLFLREFSESIKVMSLPKTPISVLMIVILICAAIIVYLGLEVLARTASVVSVLMLVVIIAIVAFLIPHYNTSYIFPLLGKGPGKLLTWGAIKSSGFSELLFAGLIVSSVGGWKQVGRAGKIALIISLLLTSIVIALIIMVLGTSAGEEIYLPIFTATKVIFFGRFFQRVEAFFLIFWVPVGLLYVAGGFYASVITFSKMCKIQYYKPLIPAFAVLIFTLAILPHDLPKAIMLDNDILRNYSWFVSFVIPLILLFIAVVRGKKTRSEQAEE